MRSAKQWKVKCKYLLKWKLRKRPWILGRHACLGLDVLNLLGDIPEVFNVQKGRIDYLLDITEDPQRRARTSLVEPFMERTDIVPLIEQEEYFLSRPASSPSLLYMDSYSELTDQLFVHYKDQWKFCCNYSDLSHGSNFAHLFEASGLLPLEVLEDYYHRFFSYIRKTYGNIPIIYLHFPIKLDKREKFKVRHDHIMSTISRLKNDYHPFHSIAIDEGVVDWPEEKVAGLENFPYHYNRETYLEFAGKVKETGVFQSIT